MYAVNIHLFLKNSIFQSDVNSYICRPRFLIASNPFYTWVDFCEPEVSGTTGTIYWRVIGTPHSIQSSFR